MEYFNWGLDKSDGLKVGLYDSNIVRGGQDFKVDFRVDIKQDQEGGPQGVLQGVFHGVESFQMDSGRGNMGKEWSGVVSAEV